MKTTSLIFLAIMSSAVTVLGQDKAAVNITLKQLVEFSNRQALQTPEARRLFADEALDWKMPTFGKLAAAADKIVTLDEKNAVGRVQWFGQDDYVADLYFYLTFQDSWKITAVRRLALTGIIEGAYRYLKTKPNLTTEEQDQCDNLELVLASDEALRQWFTKNAAGMNKLYEMSRRVEPGYVSENDPKHADIKKLLKSLHLGTIEVKRDGNIEFVFGGVTDNTVGFLYSPANQPPKISPDSYIWIEEVAPKWFIFRTT